MPAGPKPARHNAPEQNTLQGRLPCQSNFRLYATRTIHGKKVQKNLELKKKFVPLQSQNEKRSVRITVSTQDSQSCNRGSIPLPTTTECKKPTHRVGFLHSVKQTLYTPENELNPPSTGMIAPVTKLASSDARKRTIPFSSEISPKRPIGVLFSTL